MTAESADAADSAEASLQRAWELCYLHPATAGAIGARLAAQGGADAAWGWLHVALAEVRVGSLDAARSALVAARAGFTASAEPACGLALCGEVEAIALRRAGDYAGSAALLAALDAPAGFEPDAMHRFIRHNSRAITCKVLGQIEPALRHFYAARDAAERTGLAGPRATALGNLGGFQFVLYNLDDARRLSEQALASARETGDLGVVLTTAANLIVIHHAAGEMQQARDMAAFIEQRHAEWPAGMIERYASPLALGHMAVGDFDTALRYLAPGAVSGVADGDGMLLWAWLMARCRLALNDPLGARRIAEAMFEQRQAVHAADQPYDAMCLQLALSDACERCGDIPAALGHLRQAHARYEWLVGRSARARYIALEVNHQLEEAQRERDQAVHARQSVEDDHRRLVELNAALQAQMLETEILHNRLREQALRDPLTGLHNRRYLFEVAPGLLDLARRQGHPLCVVLMDLDHFKLLNDTYGHAAGDLVLQRFSALLTQMLRRSDVVARYGGEEFVAVMPDIDGMGAQTMLTRLLEAFNAQQVEVGRKRLPRGSFSAGIAAFPRHGGTLEQLLSRADRGLYTAKNHGRARIELVPKTGFGTLA